ncbi:adenylate/guanylate cyclase domain-containing protein [Tateyamaria sp.]|uniref:adenylate/guanylate cyclase domain-containing protein n=1 Tax=Tateyamaria sp. TaxID=1929288 RepID=UPI00329B4480
MRVERAILLADVSGSTSLYRQHGDEHASRLVFECVEGMQRIATIHGGEFVRSKGDDVLCLFESSDTAVQAAGDMMTFGARGEVSLHAGLHWGLVVRRGTELFGDAINIAARLSSQAKDNEVLMSRHLLDHTKSIDRSSLRSLGEHTLRGINAPTEIFALMAGGDDDGGVTSFAAQPTMFQAQRKDQVAKTTLRLSLMDWTQDIAEGEQITIGRSQSCGLVVPEAWVSRVHASISVRGGIVEFKDSSSAGTTLTIGAAPEFYICRQTVALTGSGSIALGGVASGDAPRITYQVVQMD